MKNTNRKNKNEVFQELSYNGDKHFVNANSVKGFATRFYKKIKTLWKKKEKENFLGEGFNALFENKEARAHRATRAFV